MAQVIPKAVDRLTVRLAAAVACALAVGASAQTRGGAPTTPYAPDAYTSCLFHFDEGEGATSADAAELGLTASLRNATWAEGRFGGGLDCRNGGAVVSYSPGLDADTQLTLEAWVWVDGPSDDIQRIAYRSGVYGLYLNGKSTDLTFYVSTADLWESVRAPVPTKRWVHLAGTYDGEKMRVFVDGEQIAERDKGGTITKSTASLEIGGENGAQRRFLRGRVDEVRLSHVARARFDPKEKLEFTPTTQVRSVPAPKEPLALVLPTLVMGKAPSAPNVDGNLDDVLWQQAATVGLNDAPQGAKPSQTTQAWAAYDGENLYVAARCNETHMDKLVTRVTERDGQVWQDDCVEVFVKPASGKPDYYHLAISAIGTVFDVSNVGTQADWDSKAVVGTARGEKEWTVEVALPLASIGLAAEVGRKCRFNLAREEKPLNELSSWAPVGGRFNAVGKFGWLEFAEKPVQAAQVTSTLRGLVVDEQGRRVRGAAIGTAVGTRYTDVFGYFAAEGLPRGTTQLVLATPRYHTVAVEVELAQPVELVKLPPLREVDPNALSVELPASKNGYRVFAVEPLDDLDPSELPPKAQEGATLSAFAAPGEYEPLGAAIFADRALSTVNVSVTKLRGPDGATIGGDNLDLRLVKRYLRRKWYHSPPDDAVFSSRYLLKPQPFDMAANTFRRVHLIVHVPDDAKPGRYQGRLQISPAGASGTTLPLSFEVVDVRLREPRKKYAAYYHGSHPGTTAEQAQEIIRAELDDMRQHGLTRLVWHPRIGYRKEGDEIVIDYEQVRHDLRLLKEHGFEPPYVVWTGLEQLARLVGSEESDEFLTVGEKALRGLLALQREEGLGEIVVTHMDEVFGKDRLDRYIRLTEVVRRVPELRQYITFHSRPTPEVEAMTRRIDPYVDIRCYHGHSIDMWLAAEGNSFEKFAQQLQASGDEAWCYYNPRSVDLTPEWQRLVNGYWMWLGPLTTHTPWIYSSYNGDPLDDADGFDFGYAFPVAADHGYELVPTRLWEAYREGVDDERYLTTLEALIEERKGDATRADTVKQAQQFLASLRKRLLDFELEVEQSVLVRSIADRYSEADYDQWRRECVRHILALQR